MGVFSFIIYLATSMTIVLKFSQFFFCMHMLSVEIHKVRRQVFDNKGGPTNSVECLYKKRYLNACYLYYIG